jgi:hypothetical protein
VNDFSSAVRIHCARGMSPGSLLDAPEKLLRGAQRPAGQLTPATPDEATDLAFMPSVVARMRELIEQACTIEHARWVAAMLAEGPRAPV